MLFEETKVTFFDRKIKKQLKTVFLGKTVETQTNAPVSIVQKQYFGIPFVVTAGEIFLNKKLCKPFFSYLATVFSNCLQILCILLY